MIAWRTHTARLGDSAAPTFYFVGGKTVMLQRQPLCGQRARFPDLDELGTGSGWSYQLGSAQNRTVSQGWVLSAL